MIVYTLKRKRIYRKFKINTFCVFSEYDCLYTKKGREYIGSNSTTKTGRACQRWDSVQPHKSPPSSPVGSAVRHHVTRTSVETMATLPDRGATQRTRKWKWNFAILIPVSKSSKVINYIFFSLLFITCNVVFFVTMID